MKHLIKRVQAPTPPFFQRLRNIGLAAAAVATVVLTAPIALPAALVKVAGYVAVAGGIAGAVSQTAVKQEP